MSWTKCGCTASPNGWYVCIHTIDLRSGDKYTIQFWFILSGARVRAQQVFVVTLCVYPSVTVLVSSESRGNGHPWNDVYFVPVTNYLIFNSGDYLGRILAGMLEWVICNNDQIDAPPLQSQPGNYLHCSLPTFIFCSRAISRVWLPSCRYSGSHSFPASCYATPFRGTHYPFSYIPTTLSFWWCASSHSPMAISQILPWSWLPGKLLQPKSAQTRRKIDCWWVFFCVSSFSQVGDEPWTRNGLSRNGRIPRHRASIWLDT